MSDVRRDGIHVAGRAGPVEQRCARCGDLLIDGVSAIEGRMFEFAPEGLRRADPAFFEPGVRVECRGGGMWTTTDEPTCPGAAPGPERRPHDGRSGKAGRDDSHAPDPRKRKRAPFWPQGAEMSPTAECYPLRLRSGVGTVHAAREVQNPSGKYEWIYVSACGRHRSTDGTWLAWRTATVTCPHCLKHLRATPESEVERGPSENQQAEQEET